MLAGIQFLLCSLYLFLFPYCNESKFNGNVRIIADIFTLCSNEFLSKIKSRIYIFKFRIAFTVYRLKYGNCQYLKEISQILICLI